MAVHLVKLCVGAETIADLEDWRDRCLAERKRRKLSAHMPHTTRMWPRREAELLAGGSMYWVIKGQIMVRQPIHALEESIGADDVRRCRILLEPDLVPTTLSPKRPFQGWRYLKPEDVPADLTTGDADLPAPLAADLSELGLL